MTSAIVPSDRGLSFMLPCYPTSFGHRRAEVRGREEQPSIRPVPSARSGIAGRAAARRRRVRTDGLWCRAGRARRAQRSLEVTVRYNAPPRRRSRRVRTRIAVFVALLCVVMCACGEPASESASAVPGVNGEDLACTSDGECHMVDTSCGSCRCPDQVLSTAGVRAQEERCLDVEVRCAPAVCPPPRQRAACVRGRCAAIAIGAANAEETR